ncbi:hypothetical protein [Streptacidiphilus anmyonensis]|uniref:hypothetical protein n=1 Tax=Streptacidiphilus anmyonensis TaxID=405782 RepID=UPI00128E60A3|nr:hypothetical protein [Streptacidiphilus anmyonensis]
MGETEALLSTGCLPPAERYEWWREMAARSSMPTSIRSAAEHLADPALRAASVAGAHHVAPRTALSAARTAASASCPGEVRLG